jgi:hypothetical protein
VKRFCIRALAGLPVLLVFLPFGPGADSRAWAHPFQIRLIDERTGEGLPRVRVTSDNGIVCYTRADGSVLWTESSLMDREVSFRIEASDMQRTVSVRVRPDGRADISVHR